MKAALALILALCLTACAFDVNDYYGRNRQWTGQIKQVTHP